MGVLSREKKFRIPTVYFFITVSHQFNVLYTPTMCVSILRTTECGLEYVYYHEKEMGRQDIRMEGVGFGEALQKVEDREE